MKILIVEDDPMIAKVLSKLLGRLLQQDPLVETDPRAALARFASGERFDAVFVDYHMPYHTGPEVCAAALALDAPPRLAVLMSASHVDAPAGVSVMTKPFDMTVLADTVRALASP